MSGVITEVTAEMLQAFAEAWNRHDVEARADGTRIEVDGCDLFTFRNGRIHLKNSYRKSRASLVTPAR